MPGRPHHSDKWHSCVDQVMAKGHDQQSAAAICTQSLQDAGTEIYAEEHRDLSNPEGINQYTAGGRARFDGTSPDGKVSGSLPVTILNPHSNSDKVDRTVKTGKRTRMYDKDGQTHLPTATVKTDRGTVFEAHHHQLKALEEAHDDLRAMMLRTAGVAPRVEHLHGREHLVVPVVALMEGVIHAVNADVPEYVTPEFLKMAAQSWDGRPCVLGHPTVSGVQVSANDPRISDQREFGRVYNARVKGNRLAMEAWIDPVRLAAMGETEMLADLRAGKPIEVSVGANVKTVPSTGDYNGRKYAAKWLSGSGDHLAFLPRGRGACSVEMGCGACRAAQAVPEYEIMADGLRELSNPEGINQYTKGGGGDGSVGDYHVVNDATDHVVSHHDTQREAQTAARSQANWTRQSHSVGRAGTVYGTSEHISTHDPESSSRSKVDRPRRVRLSQAKGSAEDKPMTLLERLRAFATSVRTLSNPEGINQYSKGGSGKGGESAAKMHDRAANLHDKAAAANTKAANYGGTSSDPHNAAKEASQKAHDASDLASSHGSLVATDAIQSAYSKSDDANLAASEAHNKTAAGWHKEAADQHRAIASQLRGGKRSASMYDTPEQAASEEAAELVGYQALRSHLDAMASALGDASGIVDDLISDETDDPTETPAQEDAEEEVETARIEALMSLLGLIGSAAGNAMSVCMNLNAPDPNDVAPARYMAGKEISAKNMKTIQAAHDAAHSMHDHTTNLGAQCNGMRLLSTGESTMTKQEKDTLIKALTECNCSGFVTGDVKALETMTDEQLTRLKQRADATAKTEADLKAAAAQVDEAKAKTIETEAKLKAASEKKLTEEEALAQFPSIKALVDKASADEAARKADLVNKLKTAQSAYTEEELKTLALPMLAKLAVIAKVDQPVADYSGRGLAMSSAKDDLDQYEPPDPYAAGLKTMAERRTN